MIRMHSETRDDHYSDDSGFIPIDIFRVNKGRTESSLSLSLSFGLPFFLSASYCKHGSNEWILPLCYKIHILFALPDDDKSRKGI